MDMISPSIAALTPSLTLKVTNRAKAMKASGEEVYGLAGGEPEMDTPENIKQAAIAALNNGATKYTPSAGLPALRQAIAEKLKRENNLIRFHPDHRGSRRQARLFQRHHGDRIRGG